MADPFKIIALEQLMNVGHAKLHFEALRSQYKDYDTLILKCREYAMKRRLEHTHKNKSDDMDIGQVDDYIMEQSWDMGRGHISYDYNDPWGAWNTDYREGQS